MIDQPMRTEAFDELENPFAEHAFADETERDSFEEGFTPWTESFDPFTESFDRESGEAPGFEVQAGFGEAYAELRDEAFDEALEQLADETAEAVGGTAFASESADAMRSGEAYLAPIHAASEAYIDRLLESLEQLDLASLSEAQLEEQFDRIDTEAYRLSPAGEDFLGGLVRKAKRAASFVVNKAKAVGRTVIAPALRAVFGRLKTLVRPLLQRVLSFAIGRLPAPLQPAARALAKRITGEAEDESELESLDEGPVLVLASLAVDPEQIAEGFDAALAEAAVLGAESEQPEAEYLDGSEAENDPYGSTVGGRELEALAEARATLLDRLAAADESEDLAPAIEQFIPAVLAALRVGVRVIGRPRVVRFLAKYLANYIGKWTGPKLAGPLSVAIVDTGMRLATLEAEGEASESGGPGEVVGERDLSAALLANTVEDTARRLAELEDFQLEDEDLLQLAMSEAFEEAVTANFPASVVREELQLAPSLQVSFIPRASRSRSPYRVLNRRPELSLTPQQAGAIRTFGGLTLTASLKSRGTNLPARFRVHIVQVAVGGSLRTVAADLRKRFTTFRPTPGMFHPLTPAAAAALFREPRLGARVAPQFLRSRRRIAAGQRFYILEPLGAAGGIGGRTGGVSTSTAGSAPATRGVPSQGWAVIDLKQAVVRVSLHLTEQDAQRIASDIRSGIAPAAALRTLASIYEGVARSFANPDGRVRVIREAESEDEQFLGGALRAASQKVIGALARVLRSWVLPAISNWLRTKSAEFARAAANPANGVTLVLTLRGVPGLRVIGDVLAGRNLISNTRAILNGNAFRGAPSIDAVVRPGLVRP